MRQATQKIHDLIANKGENSLSIPVNELLDEIRKVGILNGSDGSIKTRIYELPKEFPYFKIEKGILHYDKKIALELSIPSPTSEKNQEKILELLTWRKKNYVKCLERNKFQGLAVDLHEVFQFDMDLFDWIVENPDEATKLFQEGVELEFHLREIVPNLPECRISFPNAYPPNTSPSLVRDLKAKHINKLISLYAVSLRVDSTKPAVKVGRFICNKCNTEHDEPQNTSKLTFPLFCRSCKKRDFRFVPDASEWTDIQAMEFTEPLSKLDGLSSESIDAYVEGATHITVVGEESEITGILRRKSPRKRSRVYEKQLQVLSLKKKDTQGELSEDDLDVIKTYAQDKKIFQHLRGSIAPFIYGYDEIKEAISLQLFNCPSSWYGGDRKRGDIHVLLIGDPAVAKSKILVYASYLSPRSIYVSGRGATSAGLTATAEQTEGKGWRLRAGAMVLASGGLLCVDEFNLCGREVQKGLNEGMEGGTVSIAKAGITTSLPAAVSILAAANPVFDRFDSHGKSLVKQYNIPATTLSRFDLIFPILDIKDSEKDEKISETILQGWRKEFEDFDSEIEPELLRKYAQHARSIAPLMSEEVSKVVSDYYVDRRKSTKKGIPLTPRSVESIIRLATASARVRLDPNVSKEDVDRAIKLYDFMLKETASDENGNIDIDNIYATHSSREREVIRLFEEIIRDLIMESEDGIAFVEDIIDAAASKKIDRFKAEQILMELKTKGIIYEPRHGRYMLTEK